MQTIRLQVFSETNALVFRTPTKCATDILAEANKHLRDAGFIWQATHPCALEVFDDGVWGPYL